MEMTAVDLEPLLRSRPDKVQVKTDAEYAEINRLADAGLFRIYAVSVATPGKKWRWQFEIIWPAEQITFTQDV